VDESNGSSQSLIKNTAGGGNGGADVNSGGAGVNGGGVNGGGSPLHTGSAVHIGAFAVHSAQLNKVSQHMSKGRGSFGALV